MTQSKHNYLNEFDKTIYSYLTDRQWSVAIAKNVKCRRKKLLIGKVCAVMSVFCIIGGGAVSSLLNRDTAYSQFYAYISESAGYDYDILDLHK